MMLHSVFVPVRLFWPNVDLVWGQNVFSSFLVGQILGELERSDQANSLWFRNPCNCILNQMLLHVSDVSPFSFN